MLRHILSAVLVLIFGASFVLAQSPDIPLSNAHDQQVIVVPEDANQPPADAAVMPDAALNDCGCQQPTTCTGSAGCGTQYQRPTWKEQCAYYRSVRQAFDRGPCCAQHFGGFGPLWDSYCADKQRCCFDEQRCCAETCAPAAPCLPCMPRAWPKLRRRHTHAQCDVCTGSACDGTNSGTVAPEQAPLDIGQPPNPQPQPEPAVEDAATAVPLLDDIPRPEDIPTARLGWPQRTAHWPSR